MKKISEFLSENFHSLVVKFSVYLNRLVFVCSSVKSVAFILKVVFSKRKEFSPLFEYFFKRSEGT